MLRIYNPNRKIYSLGIEDCWSKSGKSFTNLELLTFINDIGLRKFNIMVNEGCLVTEEELESKVSTPIYKWLKETSLEKIC